jgi:hypothetical protein
MLDHAKMLGGGRDAEPIVSRIIAHSIQRIRRADRRLARVP